MDRGGGLQAIEPKENARTGSIAGAIARRDTGIRAIRPGGMRISVAAI